MKTGTLRISQASNQLSGDLQDKWLSLVAGLIRGDRRLTAERIGYQLLKVLMIGHLL